MHNNMIEYKIKKWSCSCGYKQDFEPTQENMDRNFNLLKDSIERGIAAYQCPSCRKGVLK